MAGNWSMFQSPTASTLLPQGLFLIKWAMSAKESTRTSPCAQYTPTMNKFTPKDLEEPLWNKCSAPQRPRHTISLTRCLILSLIINCMAKLPTPGQCLKVKTPDCNDGSRHSLCASSSHMNKTCHRGTAEETTLINARRLSLSPQAFPQLTAATFSFRSSTLSHSCSA